MVHTAQAWAHTPGPSGEPHRLVDHLRAVAETARQFAECFQAGDLAYWIGLWHDLGKFDPQFQAYLRACAANPEAARRGPDHKAAGAKLAADRAGAAALVVHGHHGGLRSPTDLKLWLAERLKDPAVHAALAQASREIADLDPGQRVGPPAESER